MKNINAVIKMISKKFNVKSVEEFNYPRSDSATSLKFKRVQFVIVSKHGMPCIIYIEAKEVNKNTRQIKNIVELLVNIYAAC